MCAATPTCPRRPALPIDIRALILAAQDITVDQVPVPEWGTTLSVRSMTGTARARMLKSAMDADTGEMDFERMYPEVLIATVVDSVTLLPLFTPRRRRPAQPEKRLGPGAGRQGWDEGLRHGPEHRDGPGKGLLAGERRFYYELAGELGGMTVEEMLDRMSAREIAEWLIVYKLRENEREKARQAQQ